MNSENKITCPKCSHEFDVTSYLSGKLEAEFQKKFNANKAELEKKTQLALKEIEDPKRMLDDRQLHQDEELKEKLQKMKSDYEQQVRTSIESEIKGKVEFLEKDIADKQKKIQDMGRKETELLQKENQLKEFLENAEYEMQKKLLEEKEKIKEEAEKRAEEKAQLQLQMKQNELDQQKDDMDLTISRRIQEQAEKIRNEERLRQAELQKQLEDQKKLVDEMKRKSEQGSMQLQGEVQEIELESLLQEIYRHDTIGEVGKGTKGADCIQVVRNEAGRECGKIIYECKRTKVFAGDWPDKLKKDMIASRADVAVLVTRAFPSGMTRFGLHGGVWVCSFEEVQSVSMILRHGLIQLGNAIGAQENKGDKMVMLYNFLTGNEFRQQVEAIVEGFSSIKDNLEKEKRSMYKMWAEREKQIQKVIESTMGMYGSVKGIAGSAVQEIRELEAPGEDVQTEE